MKTFKQYISEELNFHQKSYIDSITHNSAPNARDTEFSDHVFGGASSGLGRWDDKDVHVIPFDKKDLFTKVPTAIGRHLSAHGYRVHDWSKGLAVRTDLPAGKKPRPIGIGKILAATRDKGGETHYWAENAWRSHNEHASHADHDLEIMITRHPYHIGEQSTNKGWRSCLTLGVCPDESDHEYRDDPFVEKEYRQKRERAAQQALRLGRANQDPGQFAFKVGDDILGGTHMAYLIRKGDYKLKDPIARISLKPFHSSDIESKKREYLLKDRKRWASTFGDTGGLHELDIPWREIKPEHTILRPIGQVYKQRHFRTENPLIKEFQGQVEKFSEDRFPMKPHIYSYHLDDLVQRDSNESTSMNNPNYRTHLSHVGQ